jgi:hypothetical protein
MATVSLNWKIRGADIIKEPFIKKTNFNNIDLLGFIISLSSFPKW